MDYLNSQQLTRLDGYFRRFMTKGDYSWGIGNLGTFAVHVKPATGGKPQQTDIKLTFDPSSNMYVPSQTDVTIHETDYVLWHIESTVATAPTVAIVGNGPVPFNSRLLTDEDAFSHFFMLPGVYKYVSSGGAGGPQAGTINVAAPPPSPPKPQAIVVSISDGKPPAPDPVSINSGDTIHWDIVKSQGCIIRSAS